MARNRQEWESLDADLSRYLQELRGDDDEPTTEMLEWSPVWRSVLMNQTSSDTERTEPLGKRTREMLSSQESTNIGMKKMRIDDYFHDVTNPKFIPRYLAWRLPIPMPILQYIYYNHLSEVDRYILEGKFKYIEGTPRDLHLCRASGWVKEGRSFMFFTHNWDIFNNDPNSP